MGSISFISREHRLVVDGPCWPDDAEGIADAIEACAETSSTLTVDLTRTPWLPQEVAARVSAACAAAERDGRRVRVWTGSSIAPLPRAAAPAPLTAS